jgi:hypothetical protein
VDIATSSSFNVLYMEQKGLQQQQQQQHKSALLVVLRCRHQCFSPQMACTMRVFQVEHSHQQRAAACCLTSCLPPGST